MDYCLAQLASSHHSKCTVYFFFKGVHSLHPVLPVFYFYFLFVSHSCYHIRRGIPSCWASRDIPCSEALGFDCSRPGPGFPILSGYGVGNGWSIAPPGWEGARGPPVTFIFMLSYDHRWSDVCLHRSNTLIFFHPFLALPRYFTLESTQVPQRIAVHLPR